ncbi:MAG TPA: phosphatase PAP2 family protein [Kofleriaceae bacterium]|nr:phosphatase PAP2 family protein [Kofleriaceae bacterium]
MRERKTTDEDRRARREAMKLASPRAKRLAEATGHIGKWYTLVPAALAGASVLAWRRRPAAAATVATTALAATAAHRILDRVHHHREPPPGKQRIKPHAQSYPSGHAIETTSSMIAASWVLVRERIAPAWAVVPVAVLASTISGLGRLILDRHWSTDSAGGYLAGIALGSAAAGAYELVAPSCP